jgi:hypothetical protein
MLTLASLLAAVANAQNVLTVRVYDYAGLSDNTVRNSFALAARFFQRAGLQTRWVQCPTHPGERQRFPGCRGPASEQDLVLHLCPESMEPPSLPPLAYGWAVPEPGAPAHVCVRRVAQAASASLRESRPVSLATLLAYVIAHEIGHLLLGPGTHSPGGIMKARWLPGDLHLMEMGALRFQSQQARRMRERLDAQNTRASARNR